MDYSYSFILDSPDLLDGPSGPSEALGTNKVEGGIVWLPEQALSQHMVVLADFHKCEAHF